VEEREIERERLMGCSIGQPFGIAENKTQIKRKQGKECAYVSVWAL